MFMHYYFFSYLFVLFLFFFFNDTATTEIYTLSLHDALPTSTGRTPTRSLPAQRLMRLREFCAPPWAPARSEEHTSELQSQSNLVCRLLLEKKKQKQHLHSYQQKTIKTQQ